MDKGVLFIPKYLVMLIEAGKCTGVLLMVFRKEKEKKREQREVSCQWKYFLIDRSWEMYVVRIFCSINVMLIKNEGQFPVKLS